MTLGAISAVAIVLVLATLPVFAIRHPPPDSDVASRPASALLGPWVRQWAVWLLLPLERGLLRAGVSPDTLNALGLAGGVGGAFALARGELMIAAWVIAAGGICDILDGRIARARRLSSAAGAFLDSTLDRFGECATLLGLAWYFRTSDVLMLWTMAALAGSMLVSYTRARGETLGAGPVGGLMQRPERVTLLVFGAGLDGALAARTGWAPGSVLGAATVLIAAGTVSTAIYRAGVIARRLRADGK